MLPVRSARSWKSCAIALLALALAPHAALAAPRVWAIDDGEKIKQDAIGLPFADGIDNPVWSPGEPIELVALRDETVAMQIVVEADDAPLAGVTVDLASLRRGKEVIANAPCATDPTRFVGRPIERFVEHFFTITRPSGGVVAGESLGWSAGAGPDPGAWVGRVPDALIPVEVAPAWSPYPMEITPRRNGVVWIDVTVPADQAPGTYRGDVVVKAGAKEIARLPVKLRVVDATLPDRPVNTMLYAWRRNLDRRMGASAAKAEAHLFQLLRRHHLTAGHGALEGPEEAARTTFDRAAVERHFPALDGSLYTREEGYEGPGMGVGDGVMTLGTFGDLGEPDANALAKVEAAADLLAARGLLETTDVLVYAKDEDCGSPRGAGWTSLLAGSADPNVRAIRVGWTCSQAPASQPVDIPMVVASAYDPARAATAAAAGKEAWIYNGSQPQTGTFLTDVEAVSPRVNGWIAGVFDIPRWFYWEIARWYDHRPDANGQIVKFTPYDPFVDAETFHNKQGDWANGDGVMLYPGRQVDAFQEHSIGMDGVVASIRLKNLRRGVEDAGIYELARAVDPGGAEAIAGALLPAVLSSAHGGAPSWGRSGVDFFAARRALIEIVEGCAGAAD